jgi:hypothetical protein
MPAPEVSTVWFSGVLLFLTVEKEALTAAKDLCILVNAPRFYR